MVKPVKLYEAKTRLSELVERAAAGEEIVIAKGNTPMARLMPLRVVTPECVPGRWAGKLMIAEDFDAPLSDEMLAAFEGSRD